jgi:integration host factor subunit alpha
MALTKAMIVDGIHEQLGYPKNKSAEMLETLLELIKSNLEKGEDVLISGFGKFCVKEKNERRGRSVEGQDQRSILGQFGFLTIPTG